MDALALVLSVVLADLLGMRTQVLQVVPQPLDPVHHHARSRSAVLVAAATLLQAQSRTEYRTVSSDTEHFIRAAIADRFKAGDIPDLNLLPDRTRVLVRKELVDAKLTLTADALPNLPATTFEMISLQEAETLARRTGRDIVNLTVDNPHIDGDAATISLTIGRRDEARARHG